MNRLKKYIMAIAIFIISIFISITSVDASTKLVFAQNSNGNINVAINFDDGFIGGIDVTLKLNGNVKYKSFDLNKNLTNKGFVNTSYDENNHSIKIVVVTGGIGTSYNLLNNKKQLELGTLTVENIGNNDANYSVLCSSLTVLDNSWNSSQIVPELENNNFTYTVAKQDDNKDDNDDNKGDNNDQNQNNNEQNNNNQNENITNNNGTNNNSTTNQQGSNNNSAPSTNSKDNDDDKEDNTTKEDGEEKEENKKDKDTTTNKETDSEDEYNQDDNQEKSISKLWFIIPIAIVLVGVAVYFIIKNKKNKPKSNNDFDF